MTAKSTPTETSDRATLSLRAGDKRLELQVAPGDRLVNIALANDLPLDLVCCRSACGACLVNVSRGGCNLSPRTEAESRLLEVMNAPDNARLACQISILGHVEIELPIGP